MHGEIDGERAGLRIVLARRVVAHQPAAGTVGHIAVRMPHPVAFLGYLNRPDATREKYVGDWLLTGDTGLRDVQRLAEAKLRALAHQVVRSQEEERAHLSRDLHDGVSQTLVSTKLLMESAQQAGTTALLPRALERLNASLTDCVFELQRPTGAEEVNGHFAAAARGPRSGAPMRRAPVSRARAGASSA